MNPSELPLPPPSADAAVDRGVSIKVIGVGGAGSTIVGRLQMDHLDRLQLATLNTDLQALNQSPVDEKQLVGRSVTRGLGAGGDPEIGYAAADADREQLAAMVKGCDLVFIIAGMGGGTGSGAASVLAEVATEAGALVIAFVTMPFSFEGARRSKQAEDGLTELRAHADAVIPLPNDLLLQEASEEETALDSFARSDDWVRRAVHALWAMLFRTGLINLDFATLRTAFQTRGGKTLFGLGRGQGEDATAAALENLNLCPLLAVPEHARKADRLLVNIVGGPDLTLPKVNQIMAAVSEHYGRESHVIMGAVIDEAYAGTVEICVIGTSDIGGRAGVRRAVRPRAQTRPPLEAEATPVAATPAPARPPAPKTAPAKGKKRAAPATAAAVPQGDLFADLEGSGENRGAFERTDRNLFEGEDLDIPTYLRRGIKIGL